MTAAIDANGLTLKDVGESIVRAGLRLQSANRVNVRIRSARWLGDDDTTTTAAISADNVYGEDELMIEYNLTATSEEALDIVTENMDEAVGTLMIEMFNVTVKFMSNEFVSVAPTGMPTASPTRRPKKCSSDADCRKQMKCDVYLGVCIEPTPSPTEDQAGCCMADDVYASSKWTSRCREAESETECLRYGRGKSERCTWKAGEDADCGDDAIPPPPVESGKCVWNMVGKGDPDRLNRQCGRLDQADCETGGPKGICMWVPDENSARNLLVDLDGMDGEDDNAKWRLLSTGYVMDHQMLFLVAMGFVLMLCGLHQVVRRCKQRREKMKFEEYTMLPPEAADDMSSGYDSMTQSV